MSEKEPSAATLVTESLGGSSLARAAIACTAPAGWYPDRPAGAEAWRARAHELQREFAGGEWLAAIGPALSASGEARARLERVAREGGVLVTTGQQPGLFGGALLALVKALTAVALADELEALTGIPTAPLFWAATDDADYAEARGTRVALPGGAVALEGTAEHVAGTPMAATPLGDVEQQFRTLLRAAGSAADESPLVAVRESYRPEATVGGAFVSLMSRLLEPFGMPVLDAAHPALLQAARPLLARALERAPELSDSLTRRTRELEAEGYTPQVAEVAGLSLVFAYEDGVKRRLTLDEARLPRETPLGATVLLRPVLERALLPTMAYCAGPGEIAYFAQVSAVADALDAARPLVVPRWSVTIVEPHVQRLLDRLGVERTELKDGHRVAGRLAREALPEAVAGDLAAVRDLVGGRLAALEVDDTKTLVPSAAVQGARASILHKLERLERRYVAAVKRRETALMSDLATARGALYPDGKRQERALNFIPLLARQGRPLLDDMLAEARRHARALLGAETPAATERAPAPVGS